MSNAPSFLASYVLNALWQIPFVALMGWLVCRLLRRLGPDVEHRVWVAVLCLALGLPASHALRFLWIPHAASIAVGFGSMRLLAARPEMAYGVDSLVLPSAVIRVLVRLYLGVVLFFLVRFAASLFSTARLLKRSRPLLLEGEFMEVWSKTSRGFGLLAVRVLDCPGVSGPVTLTFRGPVLLLPEGFTERTSAEDFRAAVAHECAHIRRNDFLKNALYEAVSVLIAFHPVSWLIKARVAQTREMACDALAMEAVGEPRVYVQSLLRLASAVACFPSAMQSHAIGIFDANILEKRIMTLRAKKTVTSAPLRYGLIFAGSVVLLLAGAGGMTAAVGLSPEGGRGSVSDGPSGQVYSIGKDVTAPKVLKAGELEYPQNARKTKEAFKGTCLIGLIVDASGTPREVHVVRSLGKDFDEKAVRAVEEYQFSPALRAGTPVAVALNIEIKFEAF